jgi:hypothetical protein
VTGEYGVPGEYGWASSIVGISIFGRSGELGNVAEKSGLSGGEKLNTGVGVTGTEGIGVFGMSFTGAGAESLRMYGSPTIFKSESGEPGRSSREFWS